MTLDPARFITFAIPLREDAPGPGAGRADRHPRHRHRSGGTVHGRDLVARRCCRSWRPWSGAALGGPDLQLSSPGVTTTATASLAAPAASRTSAAIAFMVPLVLLGPDHRRRDRGGSRTPRPSCRNWPAHVLDAAGRLLRPWPGTSRRATWGAALLQLLIAARHAGRTAVGVEVRAGTGAGHPALQRRQHQAQGPAGSGCWAGSRQHPGAPWRPGR